MASLGHAVFPLHGMKNGRCTCGNGTCATPGKHPQCPNSFKEATTNPTIINMWFKYEPELNYGVRLGQEIGNTGKMTLVVDVDRYKVGGAEALEELKKVHGRLPATVEVLTGAGGSHYYFLVDCSLSFAGKMGKNIDLKVNGYVVGPGSVHVFGRRYEMEASSDLFEGQVIADLPQWVLDRFSTSAKLAASDVPIAPQRRTAAARRACFHQIRPGRDLRRMQPGLMAEDPDGPALPQPVQGDVRYRRRVEPDLSPEYEAGAVTKAWNSFKPGGGITYETVRMMAEEERINAAETTK